MGDLLGRSCDVAKVDNNLLKCNTSAKKIWSCF